MSALFLVATIGGRGVAIDADRIDTVIDLGEIVPVPGASYAIRGLAALRSRVVTVIDTRQLLGLAASPAAARRGVTSEVDGHLYAFLVDAVDDVAAFERQPLPSGVALDRCWALIADGIIERAGEPLLLIDLAALVRAASPLAA